MIGGVFQQVNKNVQIEGISIDTRKINKGNLFIPLQGSNSNGHLFIKDAIQNGAIAALWEKDEPNPPKDFPLIYVEDTLKSLQKLASAYRKQLNAKFIGVTGSNGKTTTKEILSKLLSTKYKVGKTIGNFNNEIGVPLTLLSLDKDIEIAVIEMGMSHKGDIHLLTKIVKPDVGVITNIGHAHLVNHGSIKKIADAKWEIVSGISSDGILFFNGDQKELVDKAALTALKTISLGKKTTNDVYIEKINTNECGNSFKLSDSSFIFGIPLIGEHQVMNALAAISVAKQFGLENTHIQQGLRMAISTEKRFNLRNIGNVTFIDDTYKSNLESVKAALQALYSMKNSRKKIFIMGDMVDMGEKAIEMHQQIADYLLPEHINCVYSMGHLTNYTIQIAEKRFGHERAIHFKDELQLVEKLKNHLEEPCILLFKASRELEFEKLIEALEGELL